MARAGDILFGLPVIDMKEVSRGEHSYCVLLGYTVCCVVGDWQHFRQTILPSTEDNSTYDSSQISAYDCSA